MDCWIVTRSCPTLCDLMDCSAAGFSVHGISQAKNTRVGCHFLLPGTFLTQGSSPYLLHWQVRSLPLSNLTGKPIRWILGEKLGDNCTRANDI